MLISYLLLPKMARRWKQGDTAFINRVTVGKNLGNLDDLEEYVVNGYL